MKRIIGVVAMVACLAGCQTALQRQYAAVPGAQAVAISQAPYEEVAAMQSTMTMTVLGTSYCTAKMAEYDYDAFVMQTQLDAVMRGATSVRWGKRPLAAGTPVALGGPTYVNTQPPAYYATQPAPYWNPSMGPDPNANANAMIAGMNASAANTAAQAQMVAAVAAMPTYEYLFVYYK